MQNTAYQVEWNLTSGLIRIPKDTPGTTEFLREDGTWAEPPGTGVPEWAPDSPPHGLSPPGARNLRPGRSE
jgi:hypothetical protein